MNGGFWDGRRVLITGAGGFIGLHVAEDLLKMGAYVIGLTLTETRDLLNGFENAENSETIVTDILDFSATKEILLDKNIQVIIHCAALDGNAEFKMKNSARIMNENMRMSSNILDLAKELNIHDVMLISSAEIYSPEAKSPILEEDDHQSRFHYTENGYVLSKIFSEILAGLYAKQFGLNVYLPRLTNVYGPRDKFDASSGRVIPSMIQKIFNGSEIEIWGDGGQVRGFIYVKDLTKSLFCMIENKYCKPLNIATEESISILDLAKLISRVSGKEGRIRLDPEKPTGIRERVLSVQKLNTILSFKPMTLENGLRETVAWYTDNKATLV